VAVFQGGCKKDDTKKDVCAQVDEKMHECESSDGTFRAVRARCSQEKEKLKDCLKDDHCQDFKACLNAKLGLNRK
jgi:hypothetical protein